VSPFAKNIETKKKQQTSDKKSPFEILEQNPNLSENILDTIDHQKTDSSQQEPVINIAVVQQKSIAKPPMRPKLSEEQLQKLEKEKVFNLRNDADYFHGGSQNIQMQTSFDSLNTVDHLFANGTVDGTTVTGQVSHRSRPSFGGHNQSIHKRDDSFVVDKELQKISNNLSSFTID